MNRNTSQIAERQQSIWLDYISRELLQSGTLARYIAEFGISGLTSNPTIFETAIASGEAYDASIGVLMGAGLSGEDLFFELALEDLSQAADLFRPDHDASGGVDGWVSLEVSPLLADDAQGTIRAATQLHRRAAKANLYIKIPGTTAGIACDRRSAYSRAFQSTSRCCSRGSTTWQRRRPTCAASNAGWPLDWIQPLNPSRHCLSVVGTSP